MNSLIEKSERKLQDVARRVMTSHITISVILVFVAVALLRAFQLETKILLRGVIILTLVNYVMIKSSQDYATSGKGYRDFLFKDPAPAPQKVFKTPFVADSASASHSSDASQSNLT